MAGKSTTLTVRILGDPSGLQKGLGQAESKVGAFERRMDKASKVSLGVLGGLAAIGKQAFDSASALQQSAGAVESVFGKQAKAVKASARGAADAVGLSASAYQDLAAVMGAQLGNMGVSADQLAGKSDALIKKGADLAATFGGTTADAVAALSSLLRGETDPIEKYGVSIKASDIAARMAADGTDKLKGAQGQAAKSAAIMALLQDQTAASTGAFGREADTAAGQQARATAAFEDAAAKLGTVLLPAVTTVAQKLAGLAGWVSKNSGAVTTAAVVFGGFAVAVLAVNGAVKAGRAAVAAYKAVVVAAKTAQFLWNLAMAANPIGAIIVAIVAVVALAVLLYKKFKPVQVIVDAVGAYFKTAFGIALGVIEPVIEALQWVWEKLKAVGDFFATAGEWVGNIFAGGAVTMQHTATGPGLLGAAGGVTAPIRGATMGTSAGGPVPAAGRGQGGNTYVSITIENALDPVAVGRQVDGLVRKYAQTTGRAPALTLGGLG